jgi:hypothetical protein
VPAGGSDTAGGQRSVHEKTVGSFQPVDAALVARPGLGGKGWWILVLMACPAVALGFAHPAGRDCRFEVRYRPPRCCYRKRALFAMHLDFAKILRHDIERLALRQFDIDKYDEEAKQLNQPDQRLRRPK